MGVADRLVDGALPLNSRRRIPQRESNSSGHPLKSKFFPNPPYLGAIRVGSLTQISTAGDLHFTPHPQSSPHRIRRAVRNQCVDTRQQILEAYTQYLREQGEPPVSTFRFAQSLGLDERAFFSVFSNMDAVESAMWAELVKKVSTAIETRSEGAGEWAAFSAKQRMLTFHLTFCEEALAWRSLLLHRVGKIGFLARPAYLRGFEKEFRAFASRIIAHGVAKGEIAERGPAASLYPEVFYVHFRSVIDFHLKDESESYERTDAYIEKSVTLAFELLGKQAIDAAVDFGKFLLSRP